MSTESDDEIPRVSIRVPSDRTLRNGWKPQTAREQLAAAGLGLLLVAVAIEPLAGLPRVLALVMGGMFIGTAWERYRILKPESGLVGALRGESREPLEEREGAE